MSKLSYEDKIDIYQKKKQGQSRNSLARAYSIRDCNISYLVSLLDKHGYDILRTTKNKKYPKQYKEDAINRVLINGEAIRAVAINIGLSGSGTLQNWKKKYKENGYNIVERKRGRSPTIMKKTNKTKKTETIEEENERLKKENLYLKAELEYSKKLRAVVQARKNQQQKKKFVL